MTIRKNIKYILILLTICAFWFFETDKEKPQEELEILDKTIEGIAEVGDGDTIKINGERIRLLGIDAPEKAQNCFDKNDEEYNCGKISQDFLINLANQKNVICKYAKRDVYKRILANCFLDNISINEIMIEEGMAVIYTMKKFDPKLKILQENAKEKNLGLWQGKFELPSDFRKRNRK